MAAETRTLKLTLSRQYLIRLILKWTRRQTSSWASKNKSWSSSHSSKSSTRRNSVYRPMLGSSSPKVGLHIIGHHHALIATLWILRQWDREASRSSWILMSSRGTSWNWSWINRWWRPSQKEYRHIELQNTTGLKKISKQNQSNWRQRSTRLEILWRERDFLKKGMVSKLLPDRRQLDRIVFVAENTFSFLFECTIFLIVNQRLIVSR